MLVDFLELKKLSSKPSQNFSHQMNSNRSGIPLTLSNFRKCKKKAESVNEHFPFLKKTRY